jgi:hypothetical protein
MNQLRLVVLRKGMVSLFLIPVSRNRMLLPLSFVAFNWVIMNERLVQRLAVELEEIKSSGLFKTERIIESAQGPEIRVNGKNVLNFCANNYLGLSSHPKVIEAAKKYIDLRGFGMSSVRFICGTQDIHKELEAKISKFLGTEDTILYAAAFDANGGVFEPLFQEQDAIISDALNHASIIDGVRLCKAQRYRYEHNNMEDLVLVPVSLLVLVLQLAEGLGLAELDQELDLELDQD